MKEEKDEQLWQQAKARVDFKTHLTTYVIVNVILWLIWLFTSGLNSYIWPIWPTMGWCVGLIFHYLAVYKFYKSTNTVEKEYKKLKKESQ